MTDAQIWELSNQIKKPEPEVKVGAVKIEKKKLEGNGEKTHTHSGSKIQNSLF